MTPQSRQRQTLKGIRRFEEAMTVNEELPKILKVVSLQDLERIDHQNVFDEELGLEIIGHIEKRTKKPQNSEGRA